MIVVVGERANGHEQERPQSFLTRLKCSAMNWGPSREMLTGLGLSWDEAFNLLPGMPTGRATWSPDDRAAARKVAHEAIDHYCRLWMASPDCSAKQSILILCGARVAQSFGCPFVAFKAYQMTPGVQGLVIPHPSPRNRMWNSTATRETARLKFKEIVDARAPKV